MGTEIAATPFAARAHRLFDELRVEGFSRAVLDAMARVPRHRFVPRQLARRAYENCALPIGYGQTISQPSIVARMTEALALTKSSRVLEVGTGCGYQAAILAELANEVLTIELVEPLATSAAARLRELGYGNVEVRCGDGYLGWPERAPFDAICVTAAADELPPPLVAQLAVGGRLVVPVGDELMRVTKAPSGDVTAVRLEYVSFVPLLH